MQKPHRAVRLTLAMEADSTEDLASALFTLATAVDRGELTKGCSGGCSSGYTYELLQDAEQAHDSYFAELRQYLARKG